MPVKSQLASTSQTWALPAGHGCPSGTMVGQVPDGKQEPMRHNRPGPQPPPGCTLGTTHLCVAVSHVNPRPHDDAEPPGVHDPPTAAPGEQAPLTHGRPSAHSMSDAQAAPGAALAVQVCDVEEQNEAAAQSRLDEHAAPAAP